MWNTPCLKFEAAIKGKAIITQGAVWWLRGRMRWDNLIDPRMESRV
jgi:hypothetical protein